MCSLLQRLQRDEIARGKAVSELQILAVEGNYRKSSKINIKKPYWRGGAIYYLRSNKQAEESKARKQAKQPDAIINEIDQLTDSEANCPECKNATHASEYMEELKIFCVPEILKSRVSRNGHFALRLIANMHN
ncbi:hypothetical protein RirG_091330 [Rhizophagus irregularis DAOM 197198w]|uniref:Uncharacterized protein n=1 Tax=Rhizophagus irregularis (strain DAOM 197198w) TaxID=1432141 RepID=A0A015MTD3_RHIIW|nr:hypothetical protein RirG_091330 [Rhizophagus irregularis DAOM 197198w]